MSDLADRVHQLSPKRLALLALELEEQLDAATRRAHAPVAVVGMACRFPGANDAASFWSMLDEGRDAVGEVPADRWDIDAYFDADPDAPARMSARRGHFLDRVDQFDAAFFGIAPREAASMDPQQRLLLEVAWHALEDARIAPDRLSGSATGVFLGICNSDHHLRLLKRGEATIDAYLASGNAHSVAAGRIAYCLGLQGPALSIDTACSSSLAALHLAVQSLRTGESTLALAAGVNIMCSPETSITLSKAHMLAPDGRCKTFDARADGFGRGEGCGVLVLKRLDEATAHGDRILAVIRGSAINQDGRSGGLTVPNGPAQEAVIGAALADALIDARAIDYVEAHGTGTSLGDPIEVRALARALAQDRGGSAPLLVGSVKTNIGHLESAAGVAGVIKVILALQHERIPAHLHFATPSPHIEWEALPVEVVRSGREWHRGERPRFAGVSSFGFSGTNAHVIIEEAPAMAASADDGSGPFVCLPLSARSAATLGQLARGYAEVLASGQTVPHVAAAAATGRAHLGQRAAIVTADLTEAQEALDALAVQGPHPALLRGSVEAGEAPGIVFLFTGQGSQYPGMGRALYESAPVFREVIDRCEALLGADAGGRRLTEVMFAADAGAGGLDSTAWAQPALFALEYATCALWRSWGIEPAAVLGHSLGEYVAACVAGVFSLEQALPMVAERGRLMAALPPGGAMAAIFAPLALVTAATAPYAEQVAIAAINAADSVVVSGEAAAVDAVLAHLSTQQIEGHRLHVSCAAHSPLMEPALDAMQECAGRVTAQPPRIRVAWTLTGGEALPAGAPDARYWRRHLRETVRFADSVASLARDGFRLFLEVGPHPTLSALAQRSLPEPAVLIASMRRDADGIRQMSHALGQLYVNGAAIDWPAVVGHRTTAPISLPAYPFERTSYWLTPPALGTFAPTGPASLPLLGRRLPTAVPTFEVHLTPATLACLDEHRVHGTVLVAGPVFLEMAQAAAREAFGATARAIEAFAIREPLTLPDEGRIVQIHLAGDASAESFAIHSRAIHDQQWRLHASGRMTDAASVLAPAASDFEAEPADPAAAGGFYGRLEALGISLGRAFRTITSLQRRNGRSKTTVELADSCRGDRIAWVHPALLDGALQSLGAAVPDDGDDDAAYLLTGIDRISIDGDLPSRVTCAARIANDEDRDPAEWLGEVVISRPDGRACGILEGIHLTRARREALARAAGVGGAAELFYGLEWEPAPLEPPGSLALANPRAFVPAVQQQFDRLAATHGLATYDDLLPILDRMSGAYVEGALRALGFDDRPGRRFDFDVESRALGILPRHGRLFARLMAMMCEDGLLERSDGGFALRRPLIDAPAAADSALRASSAEARMLTRCGSALAAVLRGEQDAVQFLFPGGSFAEARELYVDSPFAQTYNRAIVSALRGAMSSLPQGARLRMLEVGAGTGGTTTFVLPQLDGRRVEYTFTDLTPVFLERAREQFASYPFVQPRLLDIERHPREQGFAPAAFDIVIAANVVHATAELRRTLGHIRWLMAPGAMLIMLEGMAPERWVDLTFGLTEGWWRFSDLALRPTYPLIDRDAWLRLLAAEGFTEPSAVPPAVHAVAAARKQAVLIARVPSGGRRFTLVGASDLGRALGRILEAHGHTVASDVADADALLPESEIVYLAATALSDRGIDDAAAPGVAQQVCEDALEWLQTAIRERHRAWIVTRGAQGGDVAIAGGAWQACVWGLGRVFGLEHPELYGGLIDLGDEDVDHAAQQLADALESRDEEDQTRWRGGRRFVARLRHVPAPPVAATLPAEGTVLITGGFGGLGQVVAGWLVDLGVRHIALVGREARPQAESVRSLESRGATVYSFSGDVADDADMARVFNTLQREAPPLRLVLHAAADLTQAPIADLTPELMARMLRPKLEGSVVLERLTRGSTVRSLVFFSSSTAVLGASGLAHYAAANAFMDALAPAADGSSRRVLAIGWGTWDVMRLASQENRRRYREGGLLPMPAGTALEALGRALGRPRPHTVVAAVDWSVFKPLQEARRRRPLLQHLGGAAPASRSAVSAAGTADLATRLASVGQAARADVALEFVQRETAAVLGIDDWSTVAATTGLFDLGLDSLMAVELNRRLQRAAGRPLPSTLTFNYPNVAALASYLETLLTSAPAPAASAPSGPASEPDTVLAANLDELSDGELEARLLARLDQTR